MHFPCPWYAGVGWPTKMCQNNQLYLQWNILNIIASHPENTTHWPDVVPMSATPAQHQTNIGSMFCVCWLCYKIQSSFPTKRPRWLKNVHLSLYNIAIWTTSSSNERNKIFAQICCWYNVNDSQHLSSIPSQWTQNITGLLAGYMTHVYDSCMIV